MTEETFPQIVQTVLDTTDPRQLAEFYRQMFGLAYRPGDEPPPAGAPDERGQDWLVLTAPDGGRELAFQKVDELPETTWPEHDVPQQMHLDTAVPSVAELARQHERAMEEEWRKLKLGIIKAPTWQPAPQDQKDVDVLIYDKIRWERFRYEAELISPIHALLKAKNLRFETIRYGAYREENFQKLLGRARSMIFLCEHETQGFAYLQTLASGVPILAWDRGGPWKDPEFFPERVNFSPVTSVPSSSRPTRPMPKAPAGSHCFR